MTDHTALTVNIQIDGKPFAEIAADPSDVRAWAKEPVQRVSSTVSEGHITATLQCLTSDGWVDVRPIPVREEDGHLVYTLSDPEGNE